MISKSRTIRLRLTWLIVSALLLVLSSLTGVASIHMSHDVSPFMNQQLAEDAPRPQLTLRGEFDFLLGEDIHLKLAAILTDRNSGYPISDATVTFTVYDPDRNPLMLGLLVEELPDSGVYVNTSQLTMKDMGLPKGIYIVYALAATLDGYEAVDMIQFHIDPPGESSLEWVPLAGVGGVALAVAIGEIWVRRRK